MRRVPALLVLAALLCALTAIQAQGATSAESDPFEAAREHVDEALSFQDLALRALETKTKSLTVANLLERADKEMDKAVLALRKETGALPPKDVALWFTISQSLKAASLAALTGKRDRARDRIEKAIDQTRVRRKTVPQPGDTGCEVTKHEIPGEDTASIATEDCNKPVNQIVVVGKPPFAISGVSPKRFSGTCKKLGSHTAVCKIKPPLKAGEEHFVDITPADAFCGGRVHLVHKPSGGGQAIVDTEVFAICP